MPRGRPRKYGPYLPGKESSYYKKAYAPTTMVVAKKALKLARKLNKAVERKHFEYAAAGAIINDTTNTGLERSMVSGIIQGDDANMRIGNHITLKYLEIRMEMEVSTSGAAEPVRIIVWYDKENTTDLTRILLGGGAANPTIVQSPYNPNWRQDYVILHDRTYDLNAFDKSVRNITLKIPLKDKQVEYEIAGSTVFGGDLKIGAVSNAAVGTPTFRPLVEFVSFVTYTDM